jgi:5-methyltetrahydrofolate--homocysteine methyltransferase
VLATVKGDVHDIGKNLVDIILTNNGYKVYNIGIKQPVDAMIAEYEKTGADAIGMSGLLVKSTVIMKEDLQTLNERGLEPPVILGGAALNRKYVEEDLTKIYNGTVYYGADAFDGLRIMDDIVRRKKQSRASSAVGLVAAGSQKKRSQLHDQDSTALGTSSTVVLELPVRSPNLPPAPDFPTPPFIGVRTASATMAEVFPYLNELTLFSTQWGFHKGGVDPKVYKQQIDTTARPALERLKAFCLEHNVLQPRATYGFFPAAAEGQKLSVYAEDRTTKLQEFTFPRQTFGDYLCLSDYIEPLRDGKPVDFIAMMAVTVGHEVTRQCNLLRDANKYQDYLFLHGLGVETAEAYAEYFHKQLRAEWGIGGADSPDIRKLFKGHYRGRRYAFGYPACPRLEDQTGLFALIDPTQVGITLTEQFLLEPEQSTTAIVFHHPSAKYFNVKRGGTVDFE